MRNTHLRIPTRVTLVSPLAPQLSLCLFEREEERKPESRKKKAATLPRRIAFFFFFVGEWERNGGRERQRETLCAWCTLKYGVDLLDKLREICLRGIRGGRNHGSEEKDS